MVIQLMNAITAEGSPEELAAFTSLFFAGMKQIAELQEEQEQNSAVSELMKSIDEAMRNGKQNRG